MSTRFGKFVLLQRIGGGRLSQVFRVGRQGGEAAPPAVALKRVNPSLIGEPDFVQLVVREAGLLTRLSHENLCGCQELGAVDGCPFLTLELVDGCTLRALMRQLSSRGVRLPQSAVVALAHQLAEVLDYLHRRSPSPLVHLDLSPQNVMISSAGVVKLIDFGLARHLDGHEPPPVGERIAGTIGYMSPEQALGSPGDARADQFGLGILLWELLCGRRLFQGNTAETWRRMRKGQVPDAPIRHVPVELRGTVMRLLRAEPDRRFAHLGEVVEQLSATRSAPLSGLRPLSALVQHLLADPSFDPFDVRRRPELEAPPAADIPEGKLPTDEYAEIKIEVDGGAGSPLSAVRAVVGAAEVEPPPSSPFLESGELEADVDGELVSAP
jgi:eukaryotic-like serine/threonine-protein kinase